VPIKSHVKSSFFVLKIYKPGQKIQRHFSLKGWPIWGVLPQIPYLCNENVNLIEKEKCVMIKRSSFFDRCPLEMVYSALLIAVTFGQQAGIVII